MAKINRLATAKTRRPPKHMPPRPAPAKRSAALKPGLRSARNWATAQLRAASYSRKRLVRLIMAGLLVLLASLWVALWFGGFLPDIKSATDRFAKTRLMSMGFVVKHIDVVGEGRISEAQVRAVLGVQPGDYLFDMDIQNAQGRIQSLNWVESAIVRRLWPDRIAVYVNERGPYALWQEGGHMRLVDNTGIVIDDIKLARFNQKPLIVGVGAHIKAKEFLDIVSGYQGVAVRAEAFVYIGTRRWDIILKDGGTRVLLPEHNPGGALALLDMYAKSHNLLDLDLGSIDLRIEGRVTLNPRKPEHNRRA